MMLLAVREALSRGDKGPICIGCRLDGDYVWAQPDCPVHGIADRIDLTASRRAEETVILKFGTRAKRVMY
jgi:hypothetical protein